MHCTYHTHVRTHAHMQAHTHTCMHCDTHIYTKVCAVYCTLCNMHAHTDLYLLYTTTRVRVCIQSVCGICMQCQQFVGVAPLFTLWSHHRYYSHIPLLSMG